MSRHFNLALAAAEALKCHPLRAVVTVLCLLAAVVPYQTAVAVMEGVRREAAASVACGPDLYVTLGEAGRNTPVPLGLASTAAALPGVVRIRPRITGRIYLGDRLVTLVGVDDASSVIPEEPGLRDGGRSDAATGPGRGAAGGAVSGAAASRPDDLALGPAQAFIGRGVANALSLAPGDGLALSGAHVGTLTVKGVFGADSGIHSSSMVVTTLQDAAEIFGYDDRVTDLLVWVRPGEEERVSTALRALAPQVRIQSRALVSRYVDRGLTLRTGIFVALNLSALALAIPAVLVSSGLGLSERRREIGILKATGWSTEDVLEVTLWESLLVALCASGLSGVLTWVWLRPLNGYLIGQFLISGAQLSPAFVIPARISGAAQALATVLCAGIVVVGAAPVAWRAATVPPAQALR